MLTQNNALWPLSIPEMFGQRSCQTLHLWTIVESCLFQEFHFQIPWHWIGGIWKVTEGKIPAQKSQTNKSTGECECVHAQIVYLNDYWSSLIHCWLLWIVYIYTLTLSKFPLLVLVAPVRLKIALGKACSFRNHFYWSDFLSLQRKRSYEVLLKDNTKRIRYQMASFLTTFRLPN